MKKGQRRKQREKRWLKKRAREQRRKRFIEGFRNHFVRKGILDK